MKKRRLMLTDYVVTEQMMYATLIMGMKDEFMLVFVNNRFARVDGFNYNPHSRRHIELAAIIREEVVRLERIKHDKHISPFVQKAKRAETKKEDKKGNKA